MTLLWAIIGFALGLNMGAGLAPAILLAIGLGLLGSLMDA